tara:strand:- start:623 stop:946 length:324 start_codon:yes stop_codon:yes gene_type:complete
MNLSIAAGGTILVLLLLLTISVYFNIKHGLIILNIQDAIEDSLDIINEQYEKMRTIIDTPVFFDSVEIRQVINHIKRSHDALLIVANTLTSSVNNNTAQGIENKNDD